MPGTFDFDRVTEYRASTFLTRPGDQLRSRDDAVDFVNRRGFVYFWPISGVTLPSIWVAVAGDRPVADEHDDAGHVTWGWKDELLGTRRWYYAKILRHKSTMIALDVVPNFYALSENYGAPDEDYLQQYREGRLTREAMQLYETLLAQGPMDTVSLRQAARMTSSGSNGAYHRAMDFLQSDFKILPVGVSQAGAWRYAFIFDTVTRHLPELPQQARAIRQDDARATLAARYLKSVGACREQDVAGLFGWPRSMAQGVLARLADEGLIQVGMTAENTPGSWAVLSELL